MPIGDETAAVGPGRGQRLDQLLGLQSGQISLQHNNVGGFSADIGLGQRDGVVERVGVSGGVGSTSTRAPSSVAAAAASGSGVTTVIEATSASWAAATMVSMSMASTTTSRVPAENTGANRVLAALSRLTAMTSATASTSGRSRALRCCVPLMWIILPAPLARLTGTWVANASTREIWPAR